MGAASAALLLSLSAGGCVQRAPVDPAAPARWRPPSERPLGVVGGELRLLHARPELLELGAAIVYLDQGPAGAVRSLPDPPTLVFDGAGGIAPGLVAGTVGQTLRVEFEGGVLHQPFAFSEDGERIDIEVAGAGDSDDARADVAGTLDLQRVGAFRIYCSLHRSERGLVYAADSPWVSLVDPEGRYEIHRVPAGTYRQVLWSELVSGPIRSIEVESGGRLDSPIFIDARQVSR